MNEQAQSDLLQEHEVLFLDFMGFAAAVQQWDDHRMGELIRVLASIADAQSAFDVKGESQSDGSYKITSRPEITTFSDHIVVSYPWIAKPFSLVDEDRQWFKSCLGLNAKETPRDAAFCAHVVYSREPMIVPDAFQDVRFADNPVVIDEPRIRFYAGYPLMLDDGSCIGTLCLLDTRPRTLEGPDLERLHDLADIALREILGLTTR
jgi:GAF domain-containing protein